MPFPRSQGIGPVAEEKARETLKLSKLVSRLDPLLDPHSPFAIHWDYTKVTDFLPLKLVNFQVSGTYIHLYICTIA